MLESVQRPGRLGSFHAHGGAAPDVCTSSDGDLGIERYVGAAIESEKDHGAILCV